LYLRSSPAIATDGTVYIGTDYHYLFAINPDGTQRWSCFITFSSKIRSSPAIGADGIIYVGCDDNKLYAVNPDGSVKWSYDTGGKIESSPAIGIDGTVYVGSGDGKLYAIGEPDITVTPLSIDFSSV
jgi:outer membrane protein assembly factor BamB